MTWLKVQNQENLKNEILKSLNKYQQVYDDLTKSMNDREHGADDRRARCELLQSQINELKEEMNQYAQRKEEMRRNIAKDEESRNERNRQLLKVVKKIELKEKNIGQLESDMSESSEA